MPSRERGSSQAMKRKTTSSKKPAQGVGGGGVWLRPALARQFILLFATPFGFAVPFNSLLLLICYASVSLFNNTPGAQWNSHRLDCYPSIDGFTELDMVRFTFYLCDNISSPPKKKRSFQ